MNGKAAFKSKFISRHASNRQNSFQIMCQKWKNVLSWPHVIPRPIEFIVVFLCFRSLMTNTSTHILPEKSVKSMKMIFRNYSQLYNDLYLNIAILYSYNCWIENFNATLNLVRNLNHFSTEILIAKLFLSPE